MTITIVRAIAVGAVLACAISGCAASTIGTTPAAPASDGSLPQGADPVQLDPATFTTTIDNPYWPMEPGTRWTYRETDGGGGELVVTVIVTTDTKLLANGITARVVR